MKIKTKLSINLYLFVCTIFVAMMALYWTVQEYKKADENERLVVGIQKSIFERTILRDEYMQYQEERAKIQWQKQTEYIGKSMDLASERFKDDMRKAILDEMRRNYESTVTLFSKIVENKEGKHLNEKQKVLSREHENKLYSQLLLKFYALSDAAQKLIESNRRKSGKELKRSHLLTFILVVALMITTLTNSVLLSRLLRKHLETIQKGTKIIGDGNLDYRIDLRSKDEFEDFSNEFNTMSDKLKKSFVSIESLEKEITERKKVEEALRDSEGGFRAIFDNANDGILLADEETKKFYTSNSTACQMLGYSLEEIKNLGVPDIHPKEDLPYVIEQFEKQVRREIAVAKDLPVKRKDGSIFYADVNTSLVILAGRTYLLGIFRDVTEHKRAKEEREKLIQELQKALTEVKTLSGLIPICASCKKIRDDKGYWNQIESYLLEHSEAEFSHGICPDCMKKLYPDIEI